MKTQEFINGRYVTVQDNFRGYGSPGESSSDYVNFLRSNRRYRQVLGSRTFDEAVAAMGASGYATDPEYASKLLALTPKNKEQAEFLNARRFELMDNGLPPHLAELGARQSALETGWGRSLSGGNNYYGIKQHGADVRMASSDSELPPEMQTPGDPRTGQAPMNGSLPPELGDTPFGAQMYQDLMAEQEAQKSSFGERLAADPFFQMGAAILGAPGRGGNFMAAVGQGMSQGLQAAQAAEAARRETQHNQIRNQLWREQLNNERFRLLGVQRPTVYEQGQMEYQQGQIATKMRELDLRERGLYEGGGGSSDMEPWGIVGSDGSVRYESVPKGQVPKTAPDERVFNPRVGKQEGPGKESDPKAAGWAYMVDQLEPLVETLGKDPNAKRALGTFGAYGAKITAALGMFDAAFGTNLKQGFTKKVFAGLDPGKVNADVQRVVLPIAKTMVDPSGPLAVQEQTRAQLQAGIDTLEKESTWKDPELAYNILSDTLNIMGGVLAAQQGQTVSGELPPETAAESPPSGGGAEMSPEDQADLERLRRQQGNL